MFFYLTTLCLQRFTSEDAPEVPEETSNKNRFIIVEVWKHSDFLCRNHILSGLLDDLYNVYSGTKISKELWGALERKYKTEDAEIKKFLVARFLDFKIIDSKYIVSQVQELQVIIHDLLAEVAPVCIHCDSQTAIGRKGSMMYNGKSRHIRQRHNTVRELLSSGIITIDYVKSKDNMSDPLIKRLSREGVERTSKGMGLRPRTSQHGVESDRYRDYPWGLLVYEELAKSLNKKLKPKGKFYMLHGMPLAIQIWLYECCSVVPRTIASKVDSQIPHLLNWKTNAIRPRYESLMESLFNDANDKVVFENIKPTRKEISTFQILKVFHRGGSHKEDYVDSDDDFHNPPLQRKLSISKKKHQGDSSYSSAKKKLKNQSKGADQHTPKRNTPSRAVNMSSVKTLTFKLVQSEETVPSNRKDIPIQSPDMSFFKRSDEDDLVSKKVFEKFRDEVRKEFNDIRNLVSTRCDQIMNSINEFKVKDYEFVKPQFDESDSDSSRHESTPILHHDFEMNPEVTLNTETAVRIIENTLTADVEQSKLDEKVNSEVHIHEAASGEGKGELNLRDSQVTLPSELLSSLNAYVNLERSIIVHPSTNKEQTPMNVSRVRRPSKFKESPFPIKFGSVEGSTEVQTKKFNLKHPFASHPIYDIEDTKVTTKFLAWLSVDLLKYHPKKSNREEHYKENKSRMSVMNFGILSVDDKNWFYIMGTHGQSWSDERCIYVYDSMSSAGHDSAVLAEVVSRMMLLVSLLNLQVLAPSLANT
ncbi:putative glucan endo-1,3-beta-glucosidase A-like [Capsicum annuum]|nr:putative glucan endo-1,3-beta-glucosidase A-like [Capsicum annuum]